MPGRQEKEELTAAGLGEKRMSIETNATPLQLHKQILLLFPKLREGGGYELLHCLPNSLLTKIQAPQGGYTPHHLKEEVGNAHIYETVAEGSQCHNSYW